MRKTIFCRRHRPWPLFVLLLSLLACQREGQQKSFPQLNQGSEDSSQAKEGVIIRVAGTPARVRVSQTPEEMERGLMFTENLSPDEGMLFVFEREKPLRFWMKNTPLPLSVAFIDKRGRILDIRQMQPLDDKTLHVSRQPAMYALEMNAGWFEKHGIKVGDRVEF